MHKLKKSKLNLRDVKGVVLFQWEITKYRRYDNQYTHVCVNILIFSKIYTYIRTADWCARRLSAYLSLCQDGTIIQDGVQELVNHRFSTCVLTASGEAHKLQKWQNFLPKILFQFSLNIWLLLNIYKSRRIFLKSGQWLEYEGPFNF